MSNDGWKGPPGKAFMLCQDFFHKYKTEHFYSVRDRMCSHGLRIGVSPVNSQVLS